MRLRLLFDTLVFDYELPSFFFVSNDLRCKNAAQCSYYESDADAPCLSVSTNTSRFGHVLFRPNSANLVYYAGHTGIVIGVLNNSSNNNSNNNGSSNNSSNNSNNNGSSSLQTTWEDEAADNTVVVFEMTSNGYCFSSLHEFKAAVPGYQVEVLMPWRVSPREDVFRRFDKVLTQTSVFFYNFFANNCHTLCTYIAFGWHVKSKLDHIYLVLFVGTLFLFLINVYINGF